MSHESPPELTFTSFDSELETDEEIGQDSEQLKDSDADSGEEGADPAEAAESTAHARNSSLAKLEGQSAVSPPKSAVPQRFSDNGSAKKAAAAKAKLARRRKSGPDAVIVLKEERVSMPFTSSSSTLNPRIAGYHISRLLEVRLSPVRISV